jgi:hypothetical protein
MSPDDRLGPPGSCPTCGGDADPMRSAAGLSCAWCVAEREDAPLIIDHEHMPQPVAPGNPFLSGRCGACGLATDRHLSFGVLAASRIGGNALDYCRGSSPLREARTA